MTPSTLHPETPDQAAERVYYRDMADAAIATVMAGPPLPTRKPSPPPQGPCPLCGLETNREQ